MSEASRCLNQIIHDKSEMLELAKYLLATRPDKLIVLLAGEPAAGKTEFVKVFVHALSIDIGSEAEVVTSPTFALHQSYELKGKNKNIEVDHWDLYRLESEDDLESSGFWDQFSRDKLLIFIEWPERIPEGWLPKNIPIWKIQIENLGSTDRKISVVL